MTVAMHGWIIVRIGEIRLSEAPRPRKGARLEP